MVKARPIYISASKCVLRIFVILSIVSCGAHHDPLPTGTESPQSGSPTTPTEVTPTYTWISANILVPKCLSCHGGGEGTFGGVSYSNYTNTMKSVTAGNPNSSSLYTDVETGYMPFLRSKLPAEQITAIFDWITAGAKND